MLRGVPIPLVATFCQLSVDVAIGGTKVTGPVLSLRLEAGQSALLRLPHLSTYERRERAISTLVTPLALPQLAGTRDRGPAGPVGTRTRLVREQGVPVARLVPAARSHAGGEDRQVHAVQAVQELVQEPPIHPLCQREGEEARPPQAGRPLVPRPQMAVAASLSQGRHVSLACSHSGQSHRTWTLSLCAAPQWGHAELVRMPWPDTLAAVHKAPAVRPRSSEFSNSVDAVRSAARQAGPCAPSPSPPKVTGHHA